jgi:hypothetical protein
MKIRGILKLLMCTGAATLLAVSCSSFPSHQLSLDLANSETPVMMNTIDKATVKGKTLSYEAGYNAQSMTSSATNGRTTVTVTSTMAANENQPLGMQMQGLMINDPPWVGVEGLTFSVNLLDAVYFSTKKYLLHVDSFVPTTKK